MTPKEQANWIVNYTHRYLLNINSSPYDLKQRSLIRVDELVDSFIFENVKEEIYWKNVKEEIEKI